MTFALKNRVKQATQIVGINPTVTLTSAVSKFQTFAASGLSVGDVFPYLIESTALPEWEVGLGTLASSTTFTRTSVYNSSNSGALVDFSPGTKYVSLTIDAATLQAAVSPDTPIYFTDILGTASVGQIPSLDAAKITTGVFSSGRIPYRAYDFSEITGFISAGQLPAVYMTASGVATIVSSYPIPAANIVGTLTHAQVASYAFSDLTGSATLAQLPTIPTTKVSGILPAVQIDVLPASQITTGVFDITRIPGIPAANIVGTLTHAQVASYAFSDLSGSATLAQLPTTIPLTQIGTISFTDVSGSLPVTRLSGTLTHAQMASYAFSDITGTISTLQLPATYLTAADVAAILAASPTISTFSNAAHNHQGASGGGQLNASSVFSAGSVPGARGGLGADASAFAGLLKMAAGVASVATAETDYVTPSGIGTLSNKTLTTPTIASLVNATHTHQNNAGGGTLDAAAIATGVFSSGRIPALAYVTSVALALPGEFAVTNSPVSSSGTLTGAWANQTTGKFFGAPNGSTGTPGFRTIAKEDIAAAVVAGGIPFAGTTFASTDTFAPVGGSTNYANISYAPTINQTGGASGITRGVYINPTLTAAADFRGLEIAGNSGHSFYQSGASAKNYFAGPVGVGVDASTTRQIYSWTGNLNVTSGTYSGYEALMTFIPNANSSASMQGIVSQVNATGTLAVNMTNRITGVEANVYAGNTNASSVISDLRGFYATAYSASANAITELYGINIRYGTASTGNVVSAFGARFDPFRSSTGQVTNLYGIYVNAVNTGLTLNYAIYTNAGLVRFGDDVSTTGAITATGLGRFGSLRVDVSPTAASVSQTHHIPININGTTYKLLLAS